MEKFIDKTSDFCVNDISRHSEAGYIFRDILRRLAIVEEKLNKIETIANYNEFIDELNMLFQNVATTADSDFYRRMKEQIIKLKEKESEEPPKKDDE